MPYTTPQAMPRFVLRSDFQYAKPTANAIVVIGASKQAMERVEEVVRLRERQRPRRRRRRHRGTNARAANR